MQKYDRLMCLSSFMTKTFIKYDKQTDKSKEIREKRASYNNP